MAYVHPQEVTAPRELWTLRRVLIEGVAGQPAYALGMWDEKRCIGTRWNGTDDNETGWPRIYVHPCWHIVDPALWDGGIAILPNYDDKILAMRFLNNEDVL